MDHNGRKSEVCEDAVTVVDRGFLLGDLVRMDGGRGQAGTISRLEVEVQLQRALSGERYEEWVKMEQLESATKLSRGDHASRATRYRPVRGADAWDLVGR